MEHLKWVCLQPSLEVAPRELHASSGVVMIGKYIVLLVHGCCDVLVFSRMSFAFISVALFVMCRVVHLRRAFGQAWVEECLCM